MLLLYNHTRKLKMAVAVSWHDVNLCRGLLDDPDMATSGKRAQRRGGRSQHPASVCSSTVCATD